MPTPGGIPPGPDLRLGNHSTPAEVTSRRLKWIAGAAVNLVLTAAIVFGVNRWVGDLDDGGARFMMMAVYCGTWLGLMAVVGGLAMRKGYPFSVGFALGGLCFPIGLLIALSVPERR